MRPNVALGAFNAPNAALGASNAPNATLGRLGEGWCKRAIVDRFRQNSTVRGAVNWRYVMSLINLEW